MQLAIFRDQWTSGFRLNNKSVLGRWSSDGVYSVPHRTAKENYSVRGLCFGKNRMILIL
jgi:hypothetical protein